MKSILLAAETPQQLQEELKQFLSSEKTSQELQERIRESPNLSANMMECEEVINVQQYITQTIEQNQFNPKLGKQTIIYYLLIIYK